jgi:hypothetical protein
MSGKWLAAVAVCVVATGCTTTIFGSARPAADLKTAKTSTSTPAPTSSSVPGVPPNEGKKLLLAPAEVERIVGDTGMGNPIVISEPGKSDVGVVPMDCTAIGLPGRAFFINAGRTGYDGQAVKAAGGTSVGQLVATFETPDSARSALGVEKLGWERCPEGQPYTVLGDSADQIRHWVPGPVVAPTDDRLTVSVTREEAPVRTCFHILTRKSNAVVESIVCGSGDTTAQANQLADQILAKIPG